MRKIILSEFVTLDGFYAGVDGNLDWVTADDEHHEYSQRVLDAADLLLFGGATYQIFKDYWPELPRSAPTSVGEIEVANRLDAIHKLVYSNTLSPDDWNSEVKAEFDPEYIRKLKAQDGKDILMFGSGRLAQAFMNVGLIDEFHILTQPIALGKGKALFDNLDSALNLTLKSVEVCRSGVVRHYYELAGEVTKVNYSK